MYKSENPPVMDSAISPLRVALLTGGIDKHYACGLSQSLSSAGIAVDVIGNSDMNTPELRASKNLRVLVLYSTLQSYKSAFVRLFAVIVVYLRILGYTVKSRAPIFHILWNYKFRLFDRTLFLVFCKVLGKELVFTAHNVNKGERDGSDSILNRLSLKLQYRLVDHIFVHTLKMKEQLMEEFSVGGNKITVIPFGMYDMVPCTTVTPLQARQRLGIDKSDYTLLFFGHIAPYKGIDILVDAFTRISKRNNNYRLVIAGGPMKEAQKEWERVRQTIHQSSVRERILQHDHFIADDEIELYFKAADVLVLPYTHIYQSGVLFMSYTFGLPVIATDIGSFRRDIVDGSTGYLCRPNDPDDLARAIDRFFSSKLFGNIDSQRSKIRELFYASHSWDVVAAEVKQVFQELCTRSNSN